MGKSLALEYVRARHRSKKKYVRVPSWPRAWHLHRGRVPLPYRPRPAFGGGTAEAWGARACADERVTKNRRSAAMSDQIRDHEDEEGRKAATHGDGRADRQSERDAAKGGGSDQEHTNHTPPGRFAAEDLSRSMHGRGDEERGEMF